MRALLLALPLTLAACSDLPDVETTISPASQAADFPELVPLAPLLADVPPPSEAPAIRQARTSQATDNTELNDRAARLRARASTLRDAPL